MKTFTELAREDDRIFFVNRVTEVKIFSDLLENDSSSRILLLQGLGGVGKSLIIDKFGLICNSKNIPSFHTDVSTISTATDFFEKTVQSIEKLISNNCFTKFISLFDKFQIINHKQDKIESQKSQTIANNQILEQLSYEEHIFLRKSVSILAKELVDALNEYSNINQCVVLFFDTYEKVSDTFELWLIKEFLANLNEKFRIVCGSRNKLSSDWNKYYKSLIKNVVIENFDSDVIANYLEVRGQSKSVSDEFLRITKGHPLCLALAIDFYQDNDRKINISNTNYLVVVEEVLLNILSQIKDLRLRVIIEICSLLVSFDKTILKDIIKSSKYIQQKLFKKYENENELSKKLNILQIQKAKLDPLTPPYIEIEIEEISKLISIDLQSVDNRIQDIVDRSFENLKKLSLTIIRNNRFALHDLVTDYLGTYIKNNDYTFFREINYSALEYYSKLALSDNSKNYREIRISELHHLLAINEVKGLQLFIDLFFETARYSFGGNFAESLVNELKKTKSKTQHIEDWIEYSEIRLLLLQGDWATRGERLEKLNNKIYLPKELKMWILMDIGNHLRCGLSSDAEKYLDQSILIAKEIGNLNGLWEGLFELAKVYRTINEWEKSISIYKEVLEISYQQKDKNKEAKVYLHLGAIYNMIGDFKKAEKYFNDSMSLFNEDQDNYGIARTFLNYAWTQTYLGRWSEAEHGFKKSIEMVHMDAQHGEISSLVGLSFLYLEKNETKEAISLLNNALLISSKFKYKVYDGLIYHYFGKANFIMGSYNEAINYYLKAIEVFKNQGDFSSQSNAKIDLAIAYKKTGINDQIHVHDSINLLKEGGRIYHYLKSRIDCYIYEIIEPKTNNELLEMIIFTDKFVYYDLAARIYYLILKNILPKKHTNEILKYLILVFVNSIFYNKSLLFLMCTDLNNYINSSILDCEQIKSIINECIDLKLELKSFDFATKQQMQQIFAEKQLL